MKIYTKTGDEGNTSLFGGTRVPKHHLRIESYGTIDELNSCVGLLRDQNIEKQFRETLISIQDQLFTLGAMLATDPEKEMLKSGKKRLNIPKITAAHVEFLEKEIDTMEQQLPAMTHFILPGGHPTVSFCHLARCICRRAERITVHLNTVSQVAPIVLTYLNRLSDYLFVLARKLSATHGADEISWIPEKEK